MKSKQLAFNIAFQSWVSDKYFGNIFQKSISLYSKIEFPKFKLFHLYQDGNLNHKSYLVCIGGCKFKRSKRKEIFLTFVHLSEYSYDFNGWTVVDENSYKDCTYSFDKYIDLGYIENPVKEYDSTLLDYRKRFLENFE